MKKALALSLAAALSLSLLAGCAAEPVTSTIPQPSAEATPAPAPTQAAAEPYTYADTVAWDGSYDVVIVGFGGAGAIAAKSAAEEGAGVLLLDKAPEGHEGGNTRYCGQLFVYGAEDEEATYEYYKTLAGQHEIPDAMLRLYTKEIAHMYDTVSEMFGIDKSGFVDWTGTPLGSMSPEYPEFPGADKISLNTLHDGYSDGFLWQQIRKLVTDRPDQIDVWFESPATHLIQDPATKTILGVQVERGGQTLNIRAANGVILACGGFENNREMLADYLGITSSNPIGSTYNTGDGITMALEVGADLWHMEAYEGISSLAGSCIAVPEGERGILGSTGYFAQGPSILVAGDGNRYLREDEATRHGHIKMGDSWMNVRRPLKTYVICTAALFDAAKASGTFPENALNVQQAGTIAELAALIDVDADALTATVERYNGYVQEGYDPEFGRSAASMAPITGDSFYAVEVHANILNTQGGPRRNENAEVLSVAGTPIPNLYSAGELGGITAFQYQGGGNIAECIVFGQIAGKNAAAAKAGLPAYEAAQKADSTLKYTLGVESDLKAEGSVDVALGENEYLGTATGMGGPLTVKVTMDGDQISKVEVVDHAETDGIGTLALDALPGAIEEAGSTQVDDIASATITSKAIKEAVEDALSQTK